MRKKNLQATEVKVSLPFSGRVDKQVLLPVTVTVICP